MMETLWKSKTKRDLIIEVWEALDCESVGRRELEAIETAIIGNFGASAVDMPMKTARILADEGAELRHAEVSELDAERRSEDEYAGVFRNLIKFSTFDQTENTLKSLEILRQKFALENDKEGLRQLFTKARIARERALMITKNAKVKPENKAQKAEIADWFRVWLDTPQLFATWVKLRKKSAEFSDKFGDEEPKS